MKTAALACACVAVLAGCTDAGGSEAEKAIASFGDAAHGKQLVQQHACGACHAIPGIRAPGGRVGPPLGGLSQLDYIAGRLPNTPSNLARWLLDPPSVNPDTAMPVVGLQERDARDVAAYLYTLR
jgi:cytochrome c2